VLVDLELLVKDLLGEHPLAAAVMLLAAVAEVFLHQERRHHRHRAATAEMGFC
jgi:hypothetical protein